MARRRLTRSRRSNAAGNTHWTCTAGQIAVNDPEISPNQFWVVGLLTNDEFAYAPFSTSRGLLERVRAELLLLPSPTPTTGVTQPTYPVGYKYTQAFVVGVAKMTEDDVLAAGSWTGLSHDGVTVDPMDAAFYTGATDVLYRKVVQVTMEMTAVLDEQYNWAPTCCNVLELDVKVRRKLDEQDSLYLFVHPCFTGYFNRSFQAVLNARTLYRSNA